MRRPASCCASCPPPTATPPSASPSTRTANVLTCSGDGTARLWNVDSGGAGRTFAGGADYLYAVAVSADGQVIAAGGEEGVVRVYGPDGRLLKALVPPG